MVREIARPYFFRVVTGTAVIAITQRQEICAQAVWPVCRSVLWGHFKMKMARCISSQIPFIRGVTVSGGECSLYCEFVESLFKLCKEAGLNTMMDSNGSTPFAGKDDLLAVTDGVMLDIKAFGEEDHLKVTAMPNKNTLENAVFLAKIVKAISEYSSSALQTHLIPSFWRQGRVQDLSESVKGVYGTARRACL